MIGDLAAQVSRHLGRPVRVAFVDVLGPTPSEVLSAAGRHQAIVVPAFLSRGYHVRTDVTAHVAASGHPNVIVTPALGPGGEIARIVADQLMNSGWRPGDSVILGAAGTSDPIARADLHTTATLLSALTGSRVSLGFAAIGDPHIDEAVRMARADGARRGRLLPARRRPVSRKAARVRRRPGHPAAGDSPAAGPVDREPIPQGGTGGGPAPGAPLPVGRADAGNA